MAEKKKAPKKLEDHEPGATGAFDQEAMDRITDKVLAFRPKKNGAATPRSDGGK